MPVPDEPARLADVAAASDRARAWLSAAAEAVRRADRFTRMRAAIVGTWALLTIGTLWGACGAPSAANPVGADVQVNRDSIMGVQVLVRNDSGRIWRDVVLTLDGRWRYTQATMRPGDLVVVALGSFRDGAAAPPPAHVPRALALACDQGSGRYELR